MISNFAIFLTIIFIGCFAFSVIINFILLKFAQTLGVRGKDINQVRWSPTIKPSLGGISFFIIFLFALILISLSPIQILGNHVQLIGIFISITLAFLMGLADDAFNTQPLVKLITQIICGLILVLSGNGILIFENVFLNIGLTIIWVVALMNSINMLDNMDGISTIISCIVCSFAIIFSVRNGETNSVLCFLNLCVLATLLGFLLFNFHPSKMFMGDTGSQFLGLFLGYTSINLFWNNDNITNSINPIFFNSLLIGLVFCIPLTDTITVIINRIKQGKSPFVGGKDHTTHHLFYKGITEKRIFILYLIITVIACVFAYQLVFHFKIILLYFSIAYILLVFVTLYLNTIIKKSEK
jgi:UDP-GlcNAc:undecaprenyl-phosphate GlcNAc-1-phosphate transferase